jgi:hypothetical protein
MRRVAGGLNDQPHGDHDPGEAEDSELVTQLEGTCKQIYPYILRYFQIVLYMYTFIKPNKISKLFLRYLRYLKISDHQKLKTS